MWRYKQRDQVTKMKYLIALLVFSMSQIAICKKWFSCWSYNFFYKFECLMIPMPLYFFLFGLQNKILISVHRFPCFGHEKLVTFNFSIFILILLKIYDKNRYCLKHIKQAFLVYLIIYFQVGLIILINICVFKDSMHIDWVVL